MKKKMIILFNGNDSVARIFLFEKFVRSAEKRTDCHTSVRTGSQ